MTIKFTESQYDDDDDDDAPMHSEICLDATGATHSLTKWFAVLVEHKSS